MTVNIRLAVPADALYMAEVHMRSWETAYKGIIPDDYIKEKNATRPALFQRVITKDNETQYVIQADCKTVGILGVGSNRDNDLDDDVYEVHGIYLHPDYYRQGIGTQAMDFALDLARQKGKRSMVLWVLKDNINSRNFYGKCGFAPDGTEKEMTMGKPLIAVRYRREI